MQFEFFYPFAPVAKGRPRLGAGGRTYTPEKTRNFENGLAFYALSEGCRPIDKGEAVSVELKFYVNRPKQCRRIAPNVRPDLDNYIKGVFDALNGVAWHDDGQVVSVSATKFYGTKVGVVVKIGSFGNGDTKTTVKADKKQEKSICRL